MNKIKYLIDSNIIIYHLNGNTLAAEFLKTNKEISAISQITFIEVLSFKMSAREFQKVEKLLNVFHVYDIDSEIALQCVKNRNKKIIKIPDNIIAATAQINNLTLITRNVDDFKGIDIELFNIFEN